MVSIVAWLPMFWGFSKTTSWSGLQVSIILNKLNLNHIIVKFLLNNESAFALYWNFQIYKRLDIINHPHNLNYSLAISIKRHLNTDTNRHREFFLFINLFITQQKLTKNFLFSN